MSGLPPVPPPPRWREPDGATDWRGSIRAGFGWLRRRPTWLQLGAWTLLFWVLPVLWLLQWRRGRLGTGLAVAFALLVTLPVLAAGLTGAGDPARVSVVGLTGETLSPSPLPVAPRTSEPTTASPSPASTAAPIPSGPTAAPETTPPTTGAEAASTGFVTTVTRIVDGDTLYLADLDERLRLIGIDTPETKHPSKGVQCFGEEATAHLTELVPPGTEVRVEWDVDGIDRYGRPLGYLYRTDDGRFVNLAMVEDGYASAYTVPPNVAHAEEFDRAQAAAREASAGLWAACDDEDASASSDAGTARAASPSPSDDAGSVAVVAPPAQASGSTAGSVGIATIRWDGPGR